MAWDFETDPEFQKKLDWIEDFMRDESSRCPISAWRFADRSDARSSSNRCRKR